MYTRVNVPGIQAGLPRIDDAPLLFNTGDVGLTAAVFSAAAGISISFDVADEWLNEDDSGLLIYASRPQSVGVNFFKGPWRFAGILLGDAITPLTSPQVISPPPFAFSEGQKMFASARVVRVDGRLSVSQRMEGIAVA